MERKREKDRMRERVRERNREREIETGRERIMNDLERVNLEVERIRKDEK